MYTFIRCEDGKFINLNHVAFFQAEQEYGMFRIIAYLQSPTSFKNVSESTQRIAVRSLPEEILDRASAQAELLKFLEALREGSSSFDSNVQIHV